MSWEKELENEIESGIRDIFHGLGALCASFKLGVYQLRKKKNIIILTVVTVLAGIGNYFFLPAFHYAWLAAPIAVICIYGSIRVSEIEEDRKAFDSVGFKGKDGKTPYLISRSEYKGKTTTFYKSNIPLPTWNKNIELLQTALDCKIVGIEYGNSKKVVCVKSLPTDYQLPTMISWKDEYMSPKESVIVLGESYAGQVTFDFNTTPHWILAGSTGSGKSVLLRSIVGQCLCKNHRVFLMDFKRGVEFGRAYDDFCEVIMNKTRAVEVLSWIVGENERRLDMFRSMGIKDIRDYNKLNPSEPLERIVIFIDELAILLLSTGGKDDNPKLSAMASDCLSNIAILGRAAGINMVFGIQRPDANTVTGQIKSNVSGRVCGYFADTAPSMIVLNNTEATKLPSDIKGRFLLQDGNETIEMQAYYQDEKDLIESVITSRTKRYSPEEYDDGNADKTEYKKKKTSAPIEDLDLDLDYGMEE